MTKNITVKQNKKYKNGSVSMVAVLFGTTVMSLICISFIKAITSGQNQNNMYTQSQAAYDASITGINDTQLAISECTRNPSSISDTSRLGHCRTILNGGKDCKETIKAVEYVLFGESRNGVIDEESNQSYNCITINPNTNSYQGILRSGNEDGVVIPISTVEDAEYVKVSYGIGMVDISRILPENDDATIKDFGCTSTIPTRIYKFNSSMNRANNLCSGKNFISHETIAQNFLNMMQAAWRGSTISEEDIKKYDLDEGGSIGVEDVTKVTSMMVNSFPTVGFELSQRPDSFNIAGLSGVSSNASGNYTTNSGFLMLSPNSITEDVTTTDPEPRIIQNDMLYGVLIGLAGSIDKANNSPAPTSCTTKVGFAAVNSRTTAKYNCSTYIELPKPKGSDTRDPDNSYIRLTMPFFESLSGIDFEVSYHKKDNGVPGDVVKMSRTQYEVSVNGKTGERVRRTQAYIGGVSNDAIVPVWSASVGKGGIAKCDGDGNQSISQDSDIDDANDKYDCDPNGGLEEAKSVRTFEDYTDFLICEHEYYKVDGYNNRHDNYSPPDNLCTW